MFGHSWTYDMTSIVSFVLWVLQFPHEGKIVTIDHLSFTRKGLISPSGSNIPSIDKSHPVTENVGVGLYPSLMGTFNIWAPYFFLGSSSTLFEKEVPTSFVQSFKTNYINDPWILPSPSDLREDCQYPETTLPLSATEITYQSIQ